MCLSNSKNAVVAAIIGAVSIALSVVACHQPVEPGTSEQATQTRSTIAQGKQFLESVRAEMDVLLDQLAVAPIVRTLLMAPAQGGKFSVAEVEVVNAYGTYDEVLAGQFDFLADPTTPQILVRYLNGIDLSLTNFVYSTESKVLLAFDWQVSPDNRTATPEAQRFTVVASASRFAVPSDLLVVLNFLQPSLTFINGAVSYTRAAEEYAFFIERGAVNVNATLNGAAAAQISHSTSFRVWDVRDTGGITTGAPNWRESETVNYTPINLAGGWTVSLKNNKYSDWQDVSYDVSVSYDAEQSSSGFAVYHGTGSANLKLTSTSTSPSNGYEADSVSYWVAQVKGGPFTCDLSNPSNAGIGNPVTLNWLDGVNDALMPSAEISCANVLSYQPIQ